MHDIFNSTRCYASLSLKDLLDAREQYHYDLMNRSNVVATAIGYYRIRKGDPWPSKKQPDAGSKKHDDGARTLDNSEVRPYSWPAVLVFVNKWQKDSELIDKDPLSIVPKTLVLSDGRRVPVCVIYAPATPAQDDTVMEESLKFPRNIISGGFPLITNVQGQRRIASVGCLVTDGHTVYALTNKHVAGEPGTPIYSKLAGADIEIGITAEQNAGRIAFGDAYEGWATGNAYINMDVGLVRVNDINQWKTEVYSIGTMGRLADMNTGNFNLNLIGGKVAGYGAVSGKIEGEIQALFYRYKSVGGYEYMSDFLVGPSKGSKMALHHGDSGTVLMYKRENENGKVVEYMPIGVVWGQHEIVSQDAGTVYPFALVNCLSMVLNHLGVDIVRGWNIDQPYTWGKVGHYTVAYMAIDAIKDDFDDLKEFMTNNRLTISFDKDKITGALDHYDGYKTFCPLADVPDIIFKSGGTGIQRGGEKPNHYADIDLPREKDNKSLRALMEESENNFTNAVWSGYYDDVGVGTTHKGILPFRVWQIFKAMVEYISQKDRIGFLTAAGILTHYVGDACQPLHSSYMSQGEILDEDGQLKMYAKNVHTAYEDKMLNNNHTDLLKDVATELGKVKKTTRKIKTPRDAGLAVFDLMCEAQDTIHPEDILDFYAQKKGDMWEEFGGRTTQVIARGCQCMARIWEAAWTLGNGKGNIKKLGTITTAEKKLVIDLYTNHKDDFIPSVMIGNIDQYL